MRTRWVHVDPEHPDPAVIREAAALLRRGGLVAFPTETVYGLGANLEDPQAIQELYLVKQRPFKKQATLHIADLGLLESQEVIVSEFARGLMQHFWPGPLTLIFSRSDGSTIGFRYPKHPVALQLLAQAGVPVVAPSANLSGRPPARRGQEIWDTFADRIDFILDAGPTPVGIESTVLDLTQTPPAILRPGALAREIERFLQ